MHSVRKRFQQNMEDISFTIMTQLPFLGQNILADMNVEALTSELQSITRASRANTQPPPQPQLPQPAISIPEEQPPIITSLSTYPPDPYAPVHPPPPPPHTHTQTPSSPSIPPSDSSLASSLEFVVPAPPSDISAGTGADPVPRSDNDSFSLLSQSVPREGSSSAMSTSQLGTSWVDQFSEQQSSSSNSHSESRRASEDEASSTLAVPAAAGPPPVTHASSERDSGAGDGKGKGKALTESMVASSSSGLSSEAPSVSGSVSDTPSFLCYHSFRCEVAFIHDFSSHSLTS